MQILSRLNGQQVEFFIEKDKKKNKIIGLNAQKKNLSISEEKILLKFSTVNDLEEGFKEIAALEEKKEALKTSLDIAELYELLKEEEDGYDYCDIADLIFPNSKELEQAAVLECLLEDKIYFRKKNFSFYAKEEEEVEDILNRIHKEQKKEEEKHLIEENSLKWFGDFFKDEDAEVDIVPPYVEEYVNPLLHFAIYGDFYVKKPQALEIMQKINRISEFNMSGNQPYAAFRLLSKLKLFSEDENLLLRRYSIAQSFSDEELLEAEQLNSKEEDFFLDENRENFTNIYTISIDDEQTKDIDDALSFEKTDFGYRFYVHIADVSHWIEKDSILDLLASKRTSSIYLADQVISMLPEVISENLLSLREKENKYALSYIIETNNEFDFIQHHIAPSVICVDRNFSYAEVDEILEDEEHELFNTFKPFYDFSLRFQEKRLYSWGGLDFAFSSVSAKIGKDSSDIKLKVFDPFSKSNLMIKEWMILANFLSASFCEDNNLPAIYSAQDEPDVDLDLKERQISDRVLFQEVVKYMKKSYFSLNQFRHFALGLRVYTQASSPIRRFLDLIVQRQIKHFLKYEEVLYSNDDLQVIKSNLEAQKPIIGTIENEGNKYWLLKYLQENYKNKALEAVVLKGLADGFLVEIQKVYLPAKIISKKQLSAGTFLEVKLHTIIPRIGLAMGNF